MTTSFDFTLDTIENERRYVAQELHDGVAQSTLQLGLQIGICRKLIERGNIDLVTKELAKLEENIQQASYQVRDMIADMRPPQVDSTEGLDEHLQYVIDLHHKRGGPQLTYRMNIAPNALSLSPRHTLAITRIVQEALQNIRKHAAANNAWVYAAENEQAFWVSIADDGQGFDIEPLNGAIEQIGAGLANLQARAQATGGTLTITKGPGRKGTKVTVTWPK